MTVVTLSPSDDTYIESNTQATTNFNTVHPMWTGYESVVHDKQRVIIKFNLSSIDPLATILTATLRLWMNGDYAYTITQTNRVYRLKRAVTFSQVTWNKYNSGNSWSTAGGFGTNDCEQTSIGFCTIPPNSYLQYYDFPLDVSKIQEMTNGTFTNNGFLIKEDLESTDDKAWDSINDSHPAILQIEYAVGGRQFQPVMIF